MLFGRYENAALKLLIGVFACFQGRHDTGLRVYGESVLQDERERLGGSFGGSVASCQPDRGRFGRLHRLHDQGQAFRYRHRHHR